MTVRLFLLAALVAAPATAQIKVDVTDETSADVVIAVPPMPTPQVTDTAAGSTAATVTVIWPDS